MIDSAWNEGIGYSYLVNLQCNNDYVFMRNIRICDNHSSNGNRFGIGLVAQANQSLIADSIFVVNNYEEFEYDKSGRPGCQLLSNGSVEASHIYVMNNTSVRSDLEEYPNEYGCARYNLELRGNVLLEHSEIAFNNNDFRQVGLGIYIEDMTPLYSTTTLRDVSIHDNTWNYVSPWAASEGWGSGIKSGFGTLSRIELDNVHICNQQNTLLGAALFIWADSLFIRNSYFHDCGNGAVWITANHFVMENTLIHDCWNTLGELSSHIVSGQISTSARVTNCSLVDSYGDYGSAISLWSLYPNEKTYLIENCIIENTCPWGSVLSYSADSVEFIVRYSNIDGGWEGEGNIDVDPMFTDPENDDYIFLPGLPCIDAGNPDPAYNDPEDPNDPGFPLWPAQGTLRSDMGCYGGPGAIDLWEYQEDVPPGPQPQIQPAGIELRHNYPNPFNPTTTIEFTLPHPQQIQLTVYNLLGQRIGELAQGAYTAGRHQIQFNGSGLASGVYVYILTTTTETISRKMILLK